MAHLTCTEHGRRIWFDRQDCMSYHRSDGSFCSELPSGYRIGEKDIDFTSIDLDKNIQSQLDEK